MVADALKSSMEPRVTGIVIAADVSSLDDLRAIAEIATPVPEVVGVKVGFTLALRYGLPSVVKAVRSATSVPIIYDHQKAGTDIPQMGGPFGRVCRDAGVNAVIFFPLSGPKALEGFVGGAFECGLEPIVGLAMSHACFLVSEGGYISDSAPDAMCDLAMEMGVRKYVLPGTKTDIVARFAKGKLATLDSVTIMMPGIGSQGGTIGDAFKAAEPHSSVAIIGSAIVGAADPRQALAAFVLEARQ